MKLSKDTMNKMVESVKKGLADIKMVVEDGNYKLFLKQGVAVILIFLGFRWFNGKLEDQDRRILGQMDSFKAQRQNEAEYVANKKKLLDLEPRFPDVSAKNDWLLRQAIIVFRDSKLEPKLGSSQNENATNPSYTVVTLPVSVEASYKQLGNLVANIESQDEYLRISDISLTKSTETLGENTINININTVFPKEKLAASLFKDAKGGK